MIKVSFDRVPEAGANNNEYTDKPKAGAYVMKITNVNHKEANQGIVVAFDIVEGESAGYYSELFDSMGFWALSTFRSYKQKALPFFKQFVNTVVRSNDGYEWTGDEQELVGKQIGVVMGYEEYIGNDGSTKERPFVDRFADVEDVRKGGLPVPEKKTIARPAAVTWANVDDNPF